MNHIPYEIVRSHSFQDELIAVVDYLVENASYKAAIQLNLDIQSQLNLIATLPFIFPAYAYVPRFRKMPVHNWRYVIFYTINKKQRRIVLAHIYHNSRDIKSIMQMNNEPAGR